MGCHWLLCIKPEGRFSREWVSSDSAPQSAESVKLVHQHFCLTITTDGGGFVLAESLQEHIVLSVGPSIQMKLYSPSSSLTIFSSFPCCSLVCTSWELCNWILSRGGKNDCWILLRSLSTTSFALVFGKNRHSETKSGFDYAIIWRTSPASQKQSAKLCTGKLTFGTTYYQVLYLAALPLIQWRF